MELFVQLCSNVHEGSRDKLAKVTLNTEMFSKILVNSEKSKLMKYCT